MPDSCSPNSFNFVVPLNPRADDRDVALDLKLRLGSGGSRPSGALMVDGSLMNLCGARWQPDVRHWQTEEDAIHGRGIFPDRNRRLDAYYPGRNLVGPYDLTGPPPATLTITFLPVGRSPAESSTKRGCRFDSPQSAAIAAGSSRPTP